MGESLYLSKKRIVRVQNYTQQIRLRQPRL